MGYSLIKEVKIIASHSHLPKNIYHIKLFYVMSKISSEIQLKRIDRNF